MNHVLMLTYNGLAMTRDAVESVLAQDVPTKLLVLDDGSLDGTLPYLHSLDSNRVQVIACKHRGVSALWNLGLSYLFSQGAEHVLVVNNDIKLRPDALRLLIADGGQFVTCVGTSSGALWPGGEPSGMKRPHPDFSCFLIRQECWRKVGKFDEDMRIYCSDGSYHLRMHKAGINAYCLDIPFWHYASGTLKEASAEDVLRISEQARMDREAFARKWGTEMGSDDYYKMFKEVTNGNESESSSDIDVVSVVGRLQVQGQQ